MIREVQGDILLSNSEAIAHGIAVDDDFKQGLALSLREHWPSLYKDFRHYCHTHSPKQGTLWTWKGAGSASIINLFTQTPPKNKGDHPGPASTSAVGHTLKTLAQEVKERGYKSLAITRLATGVGGLKWEEVKPMVDQYLGKLDIPVYVYTTYVQGKKAEG